MPRGQKSKLRARKKRQQARGEPQSCGNAESSAAAAAAAAVAEESAPSSAPQSECGAQSLPVAGSCSTSQGPQRAPSPIRPSAGAPCPGCDKASNSHEEDVEDFSEASLCTESSEVDIFNNKILNLELYILYRYKMKAPILKGDMLHIVGDDYLTQFAEMLKSASEHFEAIFALELREADSPSDSYALVSRLKLPNNGRVRPGKGLPKTGLLMNILAMIFIHGNCISEEEIWRQLNVMQVYAGRRHSVFGEPRKLITKDFVRLKYLEYRQVHDSDPPRYEFLWGPQAHLETSKMKVLEFWAKANGTLPSAYPHSYEEALRDEADRAQGLSQRCSSRGCRYCQSRRTFQGHP